MRTSSGALGYSKDAIQGLANLLARLGSSTTELGMMSALRAFFGPGTTAGTNLITEANKFGGIVAVDPEHFNETVAIFENTLGRINYCSGRCFAVVVKVDPDTGIVENIVGVGISREDAVRIAAQFGIEINKPMPKLTPEELEMLKNYLMAMFMR